MPAQCDRGALQPPVTPARWLRGSTLAVAPRAKPGRSCRHAQGPVKNNYANFGVEIDAAHGPCKARGGSIPAAFGRRGIRLRTASVRPGHGPDMSGPGGGRRRQPDASPAEGHRNREHQLLSACRRIQSCLDHPATDPAVQHPRPSDVSTHDRRLSRGANQVEPPGVGRARPVARRRRPAALDARAVGARTGHRGVAPASADP